MSYHPVEASSPSILVTCCKSLILILNTVEYAIFSSQASGPSSHFLYHPTSSISILMILDDFDLLLHRQVARLLMSWLPAPRQVPPARRTGSHPRNSDTFRLAEEDYDEIGLTFGTSLKFLNGA